MHENWSKLCTNREVGFSFIIIQMVPAILFSCRICLLQMYKLSHLSHFLISQPRHYTPVRARLTGTIPIAAKTPVRASPVTSLAHSHSFNKDNYCLESHGNSWPSLISSLATIIIFVNSNGHRWELVRLVTGLVRAWLTGAVPITAAKPRVAWTSDRARADRFPRNQVLHCSIVVRCQ